MEASKVMQLFFQKIIPSSKRKNRYYGWQKGKIFKKINDFNRNFDLNLFAHYKGPRLEKVTLGKHGSTIATITNNRYKILEENLQFIEVIDYDKIKAIEDARNVEKELIKIAFNGDREYFLSEMYG